MILRPVTPHRLTARRDEAAGGLTIHSMSPRIPVPRKRGTRLLDHVMADLVLAHLRARRVETRSGRLDLLPSSS